MNQNQDDAEIRRLIDQRTREWNVKFRQMQEQIARKDELIEQTRNRADMQAYISRRIAEEPDEIAPELTSYVRGDTREEVEQAILAAKQKTASILDGIRSAFQVPPVPAQPEIPAQPQPQQQQPRLNAEQRSAMTPFILEQLAAVEPGSAEHLQMRRQYGIGRGLARGIFDQ